MRAGRHSRPPHMLHFSRLQTAGSRIMNTYRTHRPLLVEATQCVAPMTITTDVGRREIRPGDWIIQGEDNERYVVDDAFFQRTFAPVVWERNREGRDYGC
jgi:hypothetical protein